jgi:hypothetical protein
METRSLPRRTRRLRTVAGIRVEVLDDVGVELSLRRSSIPRSCRGRLRARMRFPKEVRDPTAHESSTSPPGGRTPVELRHAAIGAIVYVVTIRGVR